MQINLVNNYNEIYNQLKLWDTTVLNEYIDHIEDRVNCLLDTPELAKKWLSIEIQFYISTLIDKLKDSDNLRKSQIVSIIAIIEA